MPYQSDENSHIANSVIQDALTIRDELVEMLRKEAGHKVGFDVVSTRKVRALVRGTIQGNSAAYIELRWLEQSQPDEASKQSLYQEIETVLAEEQGPEPFLDAFMPPELSAQGG